MYKVWKLKKGIKLTHLKPYGFNRGNDLYHIKLVEDPDDHFNKLVYVNKVKRTVELYDPAEDASPYIKDLIDANLVEEVNVRAL